MSSLINIIDPLEKFTSIFAAIIAFITYIAARKQETASRQAPATGQPTRSHRLTPRRLRWAAAASALVFFGASMVVVIGIVSDNKHETRPDHFDFANGAHGWPLSAVQTHDGTGYHMLSTDQEYVRSEAPIGRFKNVRVTAVATLVGDSSEGGWGVWYRSTGDAVKRYEYAVTHNSAAYMRNSDGMESDWKQGVVRDRYGAVRVIAEVRNAGGDDGDVQLNMTVGNNTVGTASNLDPMTDSSTDVIREGTVGLFVYSDRGKRAELVVSSFEVVEL